MKISNSQIEALAKEFKLPASRIHAIKEVESGGKGFDEATGKILIQFEPAWFRKKEPFAPSGAWSLNKVDVQSKEWLAFNSAFEIDPVSAMESTSIGMMQVMGFHWKALGFKSVGEMWDYAKESEYNQMRLALLFIKLNSKLYGALYAGDWVWVAYYYNGANYRVNAYDKKLEAAEKKYLYGAKK